MTEFRCQKCNKLLGKYRACDELEIKCPRCGMVNNLFAPKGKKITDKKPGKLLTC